MGLYLPAGILQSDADLTVFFGHQAVRDLRNHTADVVAAVKAGERLSLTVNRMPVADIVPHEPQRSPWLPSRHLRALVDEAGADGGLLPDLADVRESLIEGP